MSRHVILLTGRAGSESVPGKNVYPVLGRPLAFYPLHAALSARRVDDVYVSTDCPDIARLARDRNVTVIERPAELAGSDAELVDGITHALNHIGRDVELLITMHCNCGVHRPGLVDECIETLQADPEADSCVTGYLDPSVHPFRTRQVRDGYLAPWFDVPDGTSSNRQQLPPCFVLDGAVRVMRVARCFPPTGSPPFAYLGHRILPVINASDGDVHSLADIATTEYHLRQLGWSETTTPSTTHRVPHHV